MIIRNRTTKTLKGSRITGRGEAPAKRSSNVSPIIGRPEGATLAVQEIGRPEGATLAVQERGQTVLSPLWGLHSMFILAGASPLPVVLSALRAFGGIIADNH